MNLRSQLEKIRRVLLIATKPTKEEFKISAKISALGILVIGIIGFGIFLLATTLGEIFLIVLLIAIIAAVGVMK